MFRESCEAQVFRAPKIGDRSEAPQPSSQNALGEFWDFVAHEYKGYTYYTGSSFPADKPTFATACYTDRELIVRAVLQDPVLDQAVENCRKNQAGIFAADHFTINLMTPDRVRFLFTVNPLATTYSERNLERDAALHFDAEVEIRREAWELTVAIPFVTLGMTGPPTEALWFDLVRQEQGNAAVSTLTRSPVMPPYNYIYEYPVFHFSRLMLGEGRESVSETEDLHGGMTASLDSDKEVRAGALCEVIVDLEVGEQPFLSGGRIRLSHGAPVLNCGVRWSEPLDWQHVQVDNPAGSGYLGVEGADFQIHTNGDYSEAVYTGDKALRPGTKLRLRVGDTRWGGPGVQASSVATPAHAIKVNADVLGIGIFEPLQPWPELKVAAGPASVLAVSNPGAVPAGEPFEVCVRAVDAAGNLAEAFEGEVRLSCDADDHTFPKTVAFRSADRGARIIEGTIRSRGVFSFAACAGPLAGQGNFIATDGSFGEGYILYGDIHCHTCTSDGWRTPEEKVHECRYLRGMQFMAISDHDFDQSPGKWEHYKRLARESDIPGRFAAYLAHEWTPTAGHGKAFVRKHPGHHYVILYPGFEGDLLRANDRACATPEKLFAAARKYEDMMVIPHYHAGRPPVAPDISYALEIVAWDGKVAETDADTRDSVYSTLNQGYRLGIIGGTDHGGEGLTLNRNGEMLAVQVDAFDRDAIRRGIQQRRTLAITHHRALIRLTMNGSEMGSVVRMNSREPRRFDVRVACRPYAAHIKLVRNGTVIGTYNNALTGARDHVACSFVDDETVHSEAWYVVKVVLHGGEPLWSSPVWASPE